MIRPTNLVVLVATLTATLLFAQEGPPGPPFQDASFFQALAMRALNEKVDLLLDQKKTDAAIQELRRVYTFDVPKGQPSFEMKVRLIGRLAELYAATGKKPEALEAVKGMLADVVAGTPAEAAAWLEAGTVYRAAGMPRRKTLAAGSLATPRPTGDLGTLRRMLRTSRLHISPSRT